MKKIGIVIKSVIKAMLEHIKSNSLSNVFVKNESVIFVNNKTLLQWRVKSFF